MIKYSIKAVCRSGLRPINLLTLHAYFIYLLYMCMCAYACSYSVLDIICVLAIYLWIVIVCL